MVAEAGLGPAGKPARRPPCDCPTLGGSSCPLGPLSSEVHKCATFLPVASNSAAGHQQVALLRAKVTKVICVPSRLVLFAHLCLVSLACLTQAPSFALQLPVGGGERSQDVGCPSILPERLWAGQWLPLLNNLSPSKALSHVTVLPSPASASAPSGKGPKGSLWLLIPRFHCPLLTSHSSSVTPACATWVGDKLPGGDPSLISPELSLQPVAVLVLLCKGHCCLQFSLLCLN